MPASTTVMQAHDEFFSGERAWPWYPVVDDAGRFLGIAEQAAVEQADTVSFDDFVAAYNCSKLCENH